MTISSTLSNIILTLISVLLTLALAEVSLRHSGFKPGIFRYHDELTIVDSLQLYEDFIMTEEGIYRHSPIIVDSVQQLMNNSKKEQIDRFSDRLKYLYPFSSQVFEKYDSLISKCKMSSGTYKTQSEFDRFACKLLAKSDTTTHKADSLYLTYLRQPFNQEGFRSIPFRDITTERPKVLLIGDSFTWGESADPIYNCFADRLAARGYLVYNTGVPGIDPVQYYATAKKYIPLLHPDIVIVNFYMNNDIIYRKRPIDENFEYITNAGDYFADPLKKTLSAKEAYNFYKKLYFIPNTGIFNQLCSQTVISSLLWGRLFKWDLVTHGPLKRYEETPQKRTPVSEYYLQQIKALTQTHNAKWLLAVIPGCYRSSSITETNKVRLDKKTIDKTFQNLTISFPRNLTAEDYVSHQSHFNNKGHRKHADFLQRKIDSLLQTESNSR